jgi:hypothetical protein
MKIASFEQAGQRRLGLVMGDRIHPLPAGTDIFKILTEASAVSRCESPVPLDSVRLLPPVEPAAIRDFIAFEQKAKTPPRHSAHTS